MLTEIIDPSGAREKYFYDLENRFNFNRQQLDHITQQYYLRARFYNPVIARFTQEGTYRGDGFNLYAYCRNNTIKYVDPTGNLCEKVKDKTGKAIGKLKATTQILGKTILRS